MPPVVEALCLIHWPAREVPIPFIPFFKWRTLEGSFFLLGLFSMVLYWDCFGRFIVGRKENRFQGYVILVCEWVFFFFLFLLLLMLGGGTNLSILCSSPLGLSMLSLSNKHVPPVSSRGELGFPWEKMDCQGCCRLVMSLPGCRACLDSGPPM